MKDKYILRIENLTPGVVKAVWAEVHNALGHPDVEALELEFKATLTLEPEEVAALKGHMKGSWLPYSLEASDED
ncbi:MAG: hypothetical protein ACRCYY_00325 [Trueperaceae bacterium]